MTGLLLRKAQAVRAGTRGQEDYDVVGPSEIVIGRIFKATISPARRPWMWVLTYGHRGPDAHARYEATCQAAMQAFARSWHKRHRAFRMPPAVSTSQEYTISRGEGPRFCGQVVTARQSVTRAIIHRLDISLMGLGERWIYWFRARSCSPLAPFYSGTVYRVAERLIVLLVPNWNHMLPSRSALA